MTFEARDSAAKVVPARLKYTPTVKASPSGGRHHQAAAQRTDSGRRNNSCQTSKWDNHLGLFRMPNHSSGHVDGGPSPSGSEAANRRALTAAFVQFSRALQEQHRANENRLGVTPMNRSPSAPNLTAEVKLQPQALMAMTKPTKAHERRQKSPGTTLLHPMGGGCALLSPYLLQRQALSMDNPVYGGCSCYSPPSLSRQRSHQSAGSRESMELGASAGVSGSQASMAMDLHLPNDCPVTLKVKDQSKPPPAKRSDTAKRHQFVRQRPVEEDVGGSPVNSCSPRLMASLTRANTEDSRSSHPRSRSNTGESRYRYRQDSLNLDLREAKRHGKELRYKKRASYAHPVMFSRSNDEETRGRRQSINNASEQYRRRRSNQTLNHYSRSNTDESRQHHSDGSPFSISRANTEEESKNSEFELAYIKQPETKTDRLKEEVRVKPVIKKTVETTDLDKVEEADN